MTVPKNVLWFEVMLYLSLTLDALSMAFQDRTPDGEMTQATIAGSTIVAGCLLALFVHLVGLAARRRKSWPRWVLAVSLVFSVVSLWQIIGESGLQVDNVIEVISCGLTAAGLYYSFTGDARGWFTQ